MNSNCPIVARRLALIASIGLMALVSAALAAQPNQLRAPSHPAAAVAGKPAFHLPPAALQRQMQQLERAKHLLDLASGSNRASHPALAARHIQAAINELKLELAKQAQAGGNGSKGAGAAPPKGPAKLGAGTN